MSSESASGSASGMSQLPVELTLTVGSISLPLARLIEMSEGETFTEELTSFFPRVRLHAADRLIGEGELVRVDGRIGFRVTRIVG
jgi:flagellar motor switch/type III secretory pathway protein FliN